MEARKKPGERGGWLQWDEAWKGSSIGRRGLPLPVAIGDVRRARRQGWVLGGLRQYLGGEETDKRGRAVAGNAWDGRRGLCQMEEIYISLGDEEKAK